MKELGRKLDTECVPIEGVSRENWSVQLSQVVKEIKPHYIHYEDLYSVQLVPEEIGRECPVRCRSWEGGLSADI